MTADDHDKRQSIEANEPEPLPARVDATSECDAVLADAIDHMWLFAEGAEIVKALRSAADQLESRVHQSTDRDEPL